MFSTLRVEVCTLNHRRISYHRHRGPPPKLATKCSPRRRPLEILPESNPRPALPKLARAAPRLGPAPHFLPMLHTQTTPNHIASGRPDLDGMTLITAISLILLRTARESDLLVTDSYPTCTLYQTY
jgi:hypothetical protein